MILESMLAFSMLGGSNYLDYRSTQDALARTNGMELSGFYGPRAERMLPIKLALTAAETGAFMALNKRHKKAAWIMVASLVAINVAASIHNNKVGK